MQIHFNGKTQYIQENSPLAVLLHHHQINETSPGLAIALNGKIARRTEWRQVILHEGDCIEVLHAVQGG